MVANLTTECAPVVSRTRECYLLCHLGLQPVLQACKVHIPDTSTALADGQQWIVNYVCTVPAESAKWRLHVIFNLIVVVASVIISRLWLLCLKPLTFFLLFIFLFVLVLILGLFVTLVLT